ncbi:Acidic mammalian chitinase [Hypsibius exemplaris]|uniref:Acidic mammalian chitinase n=1 Tax=Hypsibius exemplaris TaxID=2072580 RepID=A0A1W0WBZ9_HYPEX|nr:Acidic mammalian chitinase [Hypsibius exemplaris]
MLWPVSLLLTAAVCATVNFRPVSGTAIVQPDLPFPQIQCFFTSWSRYRDGWAYTPANVPPFLCTTIVYAFAQILDNRIALYDWKDEDNLRDLVALKDINPKLRIHLSVGGWTLSWQFKIMASVPEGRQIFVNSTIEFLRTYELDGIDVDWEYPAKDERALFTSLLQEMRSAFDAEARSSGKRRLALTIDVGALIDDKGYDIPAINPLVDLVNIMAYDFHGHWEKVTGHNAPLYKRPSEKDYQAKMNVVYSANLWATSGIPRNKLSIGIPTYGRSWILSNPAVNKFLAPTIRGGDKGTFSKEIGSLAYFEICDRLVNQRTLTQTTDPDCQCSYASKDNFWVSYDDANSITQKAAWIRDNGFNGVLVWELGMDDFKGACGGKKNPLFSAIYETFNHQPIPTAPPTRAPLPGATTTHRPPRKTLAPIILRPSQCDAKFCQFRPAGYYALGACTSSYCSCVGGIASKMECGTDTIYDPAPGVCNWPSAIPGCAEPMVVTEANNIPIKNEPKKCREMGDCSCDAEFCGRHGLGDFALGKCLIFFCSCAPGKQAFTRACPVPLVYDPRLSVCNWRQDVSTCS